MDAKEYRQNCTQKALQENMQFGWLRDQRGVGEGGVVDVTGTPPSLDKYFCKSQSGNTYVLEFDQLEGWKCDCDAHKYKGYCKHVSGLVLWAGRRGVTLPKVRQQVFTLGGKPL